jgi:hypothetical protein
MSTYIPARNLNVTKYGCEICNSTSFPIMHEIYVPGIARWYHTCIHCLARVDHIMQSDDDDVIMIDS